MLNILKEQIKDKNVLILGYGREGHSTLHRVLEVGGFSSVTVADKNQVQLPAPGQRPFAVSIIWTRSMTMTWSSKVLA